MEDVQMVRYIEHLEDYLSEFVAEVIRATEEKQIDQMELVFEILKDNYRQFLDIVNGKKKNGNCSRIGNRVSFRYSSKHYQTCSFSLLLPLKATESSR